MNTWTHTMHQTITSYQCKAKDFTRDFVIRMNSRRQHDLQSYFKLFHTNETTRSKYKFSPFADYHWTVHMVCP